MTAYGKIKAPEFPEGLDWLNTGRPLSLAQLQGKFVLLDFWTYCCINCMHIIPELKRLEAKYPNELVVIGVHAAKFRTEQETENIRQAILRYEIVHPVANDRGFDVWNRYGVRAWPTVVLIDPEGSIAGVKAGEGIFETIDAAIQEGLERHRDTLNRDPLVLVPERETSESPLSFPGKVLADAVSARLFIADSNHRRVLVSTFAGQVVQSITDDAFLNPQGLALHGEFLYIADADAHLILRATLQSGRVETVADELNSPWDLVIVGETLYIAMAGPHQIWAMDLATHALRHHAGSGYENILDGPLLRAALAQPSGITSDGHALYVADSEVSAIRRVDLDPRGAVKTIVGEGLFEFGDVDGPAERARLQHPLGVTWMDGKLYVADTYNNKIKVIDPMAPITPITMTSLTYAGTGKAGRVDGSRQAASFDEPGGLSAANQQLYVADTNNHAIRVIDCRGSVATLRLNTDTMSSTGLRSKIK